MWYVQRRNHHTMATMTLQMINQFPLISWHKNEMLSWQTWRCYWIGYSALLKSTQRFDLPRELHASHFKTVPHMANEIFTIPWRQNTADKKRYTPDTRKFTSGFF